MPPPAPPPSYLLTAAMNNRLLLWDYSHSTNKPKRTYTGHLHEQYSVQVGGPAAAPPAVAAAAAEQRRRSASTRRRGACPLLACRRSQPRAHPLGPTAQAALLTNEPSPQRQYVVSGSEDHHAYLWHLQSTEVGAGWRACRCCGAGAATALLPSGTEGRPHPAVRVRHSPGTHCASPRGLAAPPLPQVAGILRGRATPNSPGDGHCDVVLSADTCQQPGRPLIVTAAAERDSTVKVWRLSSLGG